MNRRNFIRVMPMAGGGFILSFSDAAKAITAITGTTMAADAVLGDFLSVHPNGDVTFKVIKHEMGQGLPPPWPCCLQKSSARISAK